MSDAVRERARRLAPILEGSALVPGDPGFEEACAVWNDRFRRTPALVVRCASSDDVAAALRAAEDLDLEVSVKGGGHSYAGNTVAEDSLLIDLSPLNGVEVDVEGRGAAVGGGCRWADVDAATLPHGLAAVAGTVSSVGVAGFTLGGGGGWLTRKHGMAVDNLRSAVVVTAASEVVRASEDENPDLFWALRGGSGNFGVVTAFEFDLHPVPEPVLAGQVFYPLEKAGELLRFYRDTFRDAPDELNCYPFFIRVPPLEIFPEEMHGQVVLDFVVAYLGPASEAERHVRPFRDLGGAFVDFVMPQSYAQLQTAFDAGAAPGHRWGSRSTQFDELTDAAIDDLVAGLDPFPGPFTAVYLAPHGGAPGRVDSDTTAYPHRNSAHELHIWPGWADPEDDDLTLSWARGLHQTMAAHGNGRVYVNLLGDGEAERVPEAYAGNWARLREIKRRWDPDNRFHANHNIPPY